MRLAAQWPDSHPVAKFWFIWPDQLGLPEYSPVYITLYGLGAPMRDDMANLQAQSNRVGILGQRLLQACAGSIFPCDALAISVLTRTLHLIKGFSVLIEAGSYMSAASLLRLQLDSLIRFNGVITCTDPHAIANRVFAGEELRTIKHSTGAKMSDKQLQKMLAKRLPWIEKIYKLSSGYIHLSNQHMFHMLMQAPKDDQGTRQFSASDEDGYVSESHKSSLVETFSVSTESVFQAVEDWLDSREKFGTPEHLRERYSAV